MAKATTIKEALSEFEKTHEKQACECTEVKLLAKIPPIEKMDASLSTLVKCEKLSLSTNTIEKIANLNALKSLKILSLGRNNIKSLTGLEAVGDTLEELWISYNFIEKLKGVSALRKLKVLYMSNNSVKDMGEVATLGQLPCLVEILFIGNPICGDENSEQHQEFKNKVIEKCSKLAKVDGVPVVRDEEQA